MNNLAKIDVSVLVIATREIDGQIEPENNYQTIISQPFHNDGESL